MSGLVPGGGKLPPNFGQPSPVLVGGHYVTNGLLWVGLSPIQLSDIAALKEQLPTAQIDPLTLVGRLDRRWTCLRNLLDPSATKQGGEGSWAYEYQHVGQGVSFTTDPIWHISKDDELVHAVPPQGAYHSVDVGDGYKDLVAGPEPGSPADEYRGNKAFYFDKDDAWYDVR